MKKGKIQGTTDKEQGVGDRFTLKVESFSD